ncbi:tRNA adenosine(34) deaminase TadA [Candidatus Aminicenantes bacterium AC-335-A11]|jgi:tRNA(adenine34) deaminase|nr:tRNA adenosine(34) deaminase TadA [SCandidatus Aminicenantes bacterium Aminicenantia_JdfR_composite]MCP2597183.1 tRNA adenosine(34) deaminase TadA [Candidatus Aminicenantes bacterium AC-335-G13]MCP2598288.1 tRNA adenosine(34) deaminase TadA [Candidatus Aminicenantes bacterium AC-335-L06]MCP2618940.1 tRNA adenosine(34) deaminase TadA [Candidatus Aminicenantes bacterium AC-335-A11]
MAKSKIKDDNFFMEIALLEAQKAFKKNEVPVGAVVVIENRIISRAHNQPIKTNDPTNHAEILALRKAAKKLKNYRLSDATLYCTVEPCIMCLGAIIHARIKRLVYGAPEPKFGSIKSVIQFPFNKFNHRLEIRDGVLSEKCIKILKEFFKEKRK